MLRVVPRPMSYLILKALFQGFQMRYHFFPNHFEKKVKIEKRKSPLYDRTLATVSDCRILFWYMLPRCFKAHNLSQSSLFEFENSFCIKIMWIFQKKKKIVGKMRFGIYLAKFGLQERRVGLKLCFAYMCVQINPSMGAKRFQKFYWNSGWFFSVLVF